MSFFVDKSLSWDGIYKFSSDRDSRFIIKIRQSAPNSDLWTIEFIKSSGPETEPKEIFPLMKSLAECCHEYFDEKKINKALFLISGSPEESLQKAKVFTRWMGKKWNYEIIEPKIKIPGIRNGQVFTTPYCINLNRSSYQEYQQTNTVENPTITQEIKFCFNCGTPNNSYLFCPNCGTKLKQN